MNIVHITDNAALASLAARLGGRASIPLDTEFMRVDTFHPRLALIQIGDGDTEYLVDPLAVTDFAPLLPLLREPAPRKVLHACSEDIEVLTRLLGGKPQGILDTQIGCAFLGQGLQVGYARALLDNLGVEIRKDESRSDWLQRPLSTGQVTYAALDVKFLPALYDKVRRELEARKLADWFEADCQLMLDELDYSPDPALLYRDANNAWRLRRQELAVLRALMQWREESARARDLPRTFLIRNASLFELARRQPTTAQALSTIEDMSPRILRKEGEAILAVIDAGRRVPEDEWPARLPVPLPRESRDFFDALRKAARAMAVKTGVPEEVLLRKKHVEALVMGRVDHGPEAPLPRAFRGWRGELLLPVLEPVLAAARREMAEWAAERRRSVEVSV